MRKIWLAVLLGLVALALPARAAEVRTVHVHFAHGASGATLSGHVAGREAVHYLLGLSAGQMLRVVLHSGSDAVGFNVFEPGHVPGRDGALYIGEQGGTQMEVRTAHSGDYLIQVFLNRAAARRGERANYRIEVSATGGAAAAPSRPHDATVPGTNFHATGHIPCARHAGQPAAQCRFGVERTRGRGNGQVTVFWPDGGNRVIYFEDLTPVRYDQSQADGDARMTVGRDGDLYHIRIGPQRFEIPMAVITGG
ncbi:hypothetical protein FHS88_004049 [Roseomonas alkaliterrae]|uniref:DNA breaking-rejoining protein n=2 Tax=Neoroseomonas alkaliterrae TaxID=1452450 RepID=A0A840XT73_9PROT|nr:hypothetical protein [Neoroseomonas alkaliterrae]MBB5691888.1 hypothetical protein [Neoroseomonas alkaliterrae]